MWAWLASGLSLVALSPILPLITEEYGISHTMAGFLVAVVFIITAAFGLPGGIIVGRLGLRRTYTITLFMIGSMTLMFLSPNFYGLLGLRIVYSLGMALISPATGHLIMQWFRSREYSIMTSMMVGCTAVGSVISLSTAALLADILGWERVLGLFGAVGLAAAFAWLLWGKARAGEEHIRPVLAWQEIRAILGNRTILLICAADVAVFMQYFALSSWLPTFYKDTRGMSLTQAGLIISLLPFTGIFAVLLGGFLQSKISSKRLFLIVPGAMAGLGGLGSYLISDTTLTYVAVIVLGLGTWLCIPTILTLPMEIRGMTPGRIAIYWGWLSTISGTGIFIAPLVVGAMKDFTGDFVPGFLIFSVLAWFMVAAGFLLPRAGLLGAQCPEPTPSTAPAQE